MPSVWTYQISLINNLKKEEAMQYEQEVKKSFTDFSTKMEKDLKDFSLFTLSLIEDFKKMARMK